MEAVFVMGETVRGTGLNIVQFWNYDSPSYAAVLGTFAQQQKESITFIVSVRLSDRLSASISAVPTGRIYVKTVLGGFRENLSRKS